MDSVGDLDRVDETLNDREKAPERVGDLVDDTLVERVRLGVGLVLDDRDALLHDDDVVETLAEEEGEGDDEIVFEVEPDTETDMDSVAVALSVRTPVRDTVPVLLTVDERERGGETDGVEEVEMELHKEGGVEVEGEAETEDEDEMECDTLPVNVSVGEGDTDTVLVRLTEGVVVRLTLCDVVRVCVAHTEALNEPDRDREGDVVADEDTVLLTVTEGDLDMDVEGVVEDDVEEEGEEDDTGTLDMDA